MRRHRRLLSLSLLLPLATAGAAEAEPVLEWSDLYDAGGGYTDLGTAALVDPGGHLVVGGECHDGEQGADIVVRKLSRVDGHPLWTAIYSAFDGNDMALSEMAWDGSGDLLVAGYIRGCDT